MKPRKVAITLAALVSISTLTACGEPAPETEEPEVEETATEEPVEIVPEDLTGSLSQDESIAFVAYASENRDIDVCEFVGPDLDPDDIQGFINLVMDLGGGNAQGVERINKMGTLIYARDTCDY